MRVKFEDDGRKVLDLISGLTFSCCELFENMLGVEYAGILLILLNMLPFPSMFPFPSTLLFSNILLFPSISVSLNIFLG